MAKGYGDMIIKKSGREKKRKNSVKKKDNTDFGVYVLYIPALTVLFIFTYYPVVHWAIAFFDYKINLGLFDSQFVGLKHFIEFANNYKDWKQLVANTLIMNLGGLFSSMLVGIFIAFLIETIKSKNAQVAILFISIIPFFISWASLSTIIEYFFSYNDGLINNLLLSFGAGKKNFLGDSQYAWPLMILLTTWKESGFFILVYHSAMQRISKEQYEIAEIAGANLFRKLIYITLPQIKDVVLIMLVLEVGWAFSSDLDKYYLFTNPTNISTMEVLDMYIYRYGLKLGRFSYSAAVSIVKTLISSFLFAFTYMLSKKLREREWSEI